MRMKLFTSLIIFGATVGLSSSESYAESYQVCYEKYTNSSGQRMISFTDCNGNDYVMRPQSARSNSVISGSDRRMSARAQDNNRGRTQISESAYSGDRWCDDSGCYQIKNKRDLCVLEVTGELIDCN